SHLPCAPLVLHSFPTRRSSDLAFRWRPTAALPRRLRRFCLHLSTGDAALVAGLDRRSTRRWRLLVWRVPRHRSHSRGLGTEFSRDRKSTRLNSSHVKISYAVFC